MRKRTLLALTVAAALLSTGCTGWNGYVTLYPGAANTHPARKYAHPYSALKFGAVWHDSTVAGQVGQDAAAKKSGRACSHSMLWLVAWGDSSIERAKRNATISKVAFVEHRVTAILGFLWHRHCTVVGGE